MCLPHASRHDSRMSLPTVQRPEEVRTMLDSEALSANDVARVFRLDERACLLVRTGQDSFTVDGGPLQVRGIWLATLAWWQEVLKEEVRA